VAGLSIFYDPVEFEDSVEFSDEVDFTDKVQFKGTGPAEFYVDVNFKEGDVCFDDDVEFKDDVTIQGPSDSSDSSTDFEIKGHVSVDFEQDEPFDVHTTTRFRDDVLIAKRERSVKKSKKGGSSTSMDEDHDPTLTVGGDITTRMSLLVAEGIDVQGDGESNFAGDVTVDGKLTSGSQMVTGDFEATGAVIGNTLESTTTTTTTTTVGTVLGVTGSTFK
jgi:hypothetical protein